MERLSTAVAAAVDGERSWATRVSAGLRAGLELLAGDPDLARLLTVESLATSGPVRLQHERSLERLAQALRRPAAELPLGEAVTAEAARLLAGGIVSQVSSCVLAGEAARLPELHNLLLTYVLVPSHSADERCAASG